MATTKSGCLPAEDYRISDRHGSGPGPCRADIELRWEDDEIGYDPGDWPEEDVPSEVLVLLAVDKRTGQVVDSLGGIGDPGDAAGDFEKDMLEGFPEHPLSPCSEPGDGASYEGTEVTEC